VLNQKSRPREAKKKSYIRIDLSSANEYERGGRLGEDQGREKHRRKSRVEGTPTVLLNDKTIEKFGGRRIKKDPRGLDSGRHIFLSNKSLGNGKNGWIKPAT